MSARVVLNEDDSYLIPSSMSWKLSENRETGYSEVKSTGNRNGRNIAAVIVILVVILAIWSYSGFQTPSIDTKQVMLNAQKKALNVLNAARKNLQIPNATLVSSAVAADFRSNDMAQYQYFCHYDLSGYHPAYHYTRLGGVYAMEESLGYLYHSPFSIADIPSYSAKSTSDMIYEDASSGWGHRDSLLDPTNNYVDFSVSWNRSSLFLVIHLLKVWVNWKTTPRFTNGLFSCSGSIAVAGSSVSSVLVYYSDPTSHRNHFYDSEYHVRMCSEGSYDIGRPVAGVVPATSYYLGIETLRPFAWNIDGQNFDLSFDLRRLSGKGLYTIVVSAKNTFASKHPYGARYGDAFPILEYVIEL